MTNRSSRVRSGKKSRLRYLSLAFDGSSNTKENLENGKRPHGGIKGEKKHPLSPYSYNRDHQYHQDIQDDIDKLFREEFIEQHGSPDWVLEANKDITHTDQSPLMVNKLLSPSKQSNHEDMHLENVGRLSGRRSAPLTRRSEASYYRPNSTHQYLTTTDTRNSVENGYDIRYGRPTRTTLLRARQRSNSTPVNAYEARRESIKRMESPSTMYSSRETLNVANPGESRHSFLTGARYNRAHYLDAKSLSVYGVYMPRNNPHACFMTGNPTTRIKDGGEVPAAPPDSPRSDTDELSLPLHLKRPATAPGKRLLISTAPPSGRPKSAWGDATTTCNITQNESENNANSHLHVSNCNVPLFEELIILPDDLNVRGSRVVVTIKGSKSLSLSESKLPRVKGISVPRLTHNSARDPVDETSLVNQPPPTPVGGLSINGEQEEHPISLSVKHDSFNHETDTNGHIKESLEEVNPMNTNETDNQKPEVENENEVQTRKDTSDKQVINIPSEKDITPKESDSSLENKDNDNTEDIQNTDVENGGESEQKSATTQEVQKNGVTFFLTEKDDSSNLDSNVKPLTEEGVSSNIDTNMKPEEYSESQEQSASSEKETEENHTNDNDNIQMEDTSKEDSETMDHSIKVSIEEKVPKQDNE